MRPRWNCWMMGVGVPFLSVASSRAADSISFDHETYSEDHGRMQVETETFRVVKALSPGFDLTVRGVYDGISGATPIGAPAIEQLSLRQPRSHAPIPPATIVGYARPFDAVSGASPGAQATSHTAIPLAESDDIRRGLDVAMGLTFGNLRFVPEFSYSKENDYQSFGAALNYYLDLNDRNTTLNLGLSHAYDRVLPNDFTYITSRAIKNTDDFIAGVSQLLGPGTILGINGTFSHAEGYLNDPYRSVVFDETSLDANARVILDGEKRPSTRDSQSLLLSLTQAVPPLNASVEGNYRFYHDSYGITANTVDVAWLQKLGDWAVVSPSLRYYRQGAADFYGIQFPGDPANDPAHVPRYYSSDYRLSFLETWTLGIQATIKLHDRWDLRLGYQRYWMRGLDHQTRQSTYPGANIFTAGVTITF